MTDPDKRRRVAALRLVAGGYTATEIVRAIDGRVLTELEELGLIKPRTGPRKRVTLTPAGRDALLGDRGAPEGEGGSESP